METTVIQHRRKTAPQTGRRMVIALPEDTFEKLTDMADRDGKSIKALINSILAGAAERAWQQKEENPSPSGDKWFAVKENLESVARGIDDIHHGRKKAYSMEEIQSLLGL